jgi:hypothetical protein
MGESSTTASPCRKLWLSLSNSSRRWPRRRRPSLALPRRRRPERSEEVVVPLSEFLGGDRRWWRNPSLSCVAADQRVAKSPWCPSSAPNGALGHDSWHGGTSDIPRPAKSWCQVVWRECRSRCKRWRGYCYTGKDGGSVAGAGSGAWGSRRGVHAGGVPGGAGEGVVEGVDWRTVLVSQPVGRSASSSSMSPPAFHGRELHRVVGPRGESRRLVSAGMKSARCRTPATRRRRSPTCRVAALVLRRGRGGRRGAQARERREEERASGRGEREEGHAGGWRRDARRSFFYNTRWAQGKYERWVMRGWVRKIIRFATFWSFHSSYTLSKHTTGGSDVRGTADQNWVARRIYGMPRCGVLEIISCAYERIKRLSR